MMKTFDTLEKDSKCNRKFSEVTLKKVDLLSSWLHGANETANKRNLIATKKLRDVKS